MRVLIFAIDRFAQIIILLLFARAICSWFMRGNSAVYKIYQVLVTLTEPVVAPCRMLTSRLNTGMLDISILLAFLLVKVVRDLLVYVLLMFA